MEWVGVGLEDLKMKSKMVQPVIDVSCKFVITD